MSNQSDSVGASAHSAEAATLRLFAERHRKIAAAAPDDKVRDHHLDCARQCEREAAFLDMRAAVRAVPSRRRTRRSPEHDLTPQPQTRAEKKGRHYAEVEQLADDFGLLGDDQLSRFFDSPDARHLALVHRLRAYVERNRIQREAKRYWLFHDLKPPATREWLRGPCEECEMLETEDSSYLHRDEFCGVCHG